MTLPEPFGRFVLLDKIGEGAQGDVHLARLAHGRPDPLVVKRISEQHVADEGFVRRFQHEAVIAAAVDSPHVVKVIDAGRVGGRLYLAMEYIPGWPLSRVIDDLAETGERPSLDSIGSVIGGVLEGLRALHEAKAPSGEPLAIVHRDIAPKNLMLSEDGIVKIIDLGLGRSRRQAWRTATGIVMGTPGYIAPEQAVGDRVDARADLYATGTVLFEVLTSQPYIPQAPLIEMLTAATRSQFRPPSQFRDDVSPELDEVVRRAVVIDRDERFQSAAEFLDALRHALPKREVDVARTLVHTMGWNDLADTKAVVQNLMRTQIDLDRVDRSPHERFTPDTLPRLAEEPPTGPRVRQSRTSPPRSRTLAAAAMIVTAAAVFALGWFGRDLADGRHPETPAPTATVPPAAAGPVPSASARKGAPPLKARTPRPPSVRTEPRTKPPAGSTSAVVAPPEPPPPAQPTVIKTQGELRAELSALLDEAKLLRERAPPGDQVEVIDLVGDLGRLMAGAPPDEEQVERLRARLRAFQ